MKIAVLSGKGGTGKTLVSVNLAAVAERATYIDCDVEEPNGHLFLKPQDVISKDIGVLVPVIDDEKCTQCRKCVDFCKYNALAMINKKVIVFDNVCHACGGCALLCPEKAIVEKEKNIGQVKKGQSDNVSVISGILNTGETSGVPIIKDIVVQDQTDTELTVIDCPPGSACVVMESIKEADYCVMVAEPTVFGAHNLGMVYDLVKLFNKPHGVVLNKCLEGENPSEIFCQENKVRILGKIPFDNDLGTLNSNALVAVREDKKYEDLFHLLLKNVMMEVERETIINP
jgi:MinD superfamily P-loop ATPase